jgi:hypothetical protein
LGWHIDRAGLPVRFSPTSERSPISVIDGDFDLVTGVVGFVYQGVHKMVSISANGTSAICLQVALTAPSQWRCCEFGWMREAKRENTRCGL